MEDSRNINSNRRSTAKSGVTYLNSLLRGFNSNMYDERTAVSARIKVIPAETLTKGANRTLNAALRLEEDFNGIAFALAYSSTFQMAKALLTHLGLLDDVREADRPVALKLNEYYYSNIEKFTRTACPLGIELKWMLQDSIRSLRNDSLHTGLNNTNKQDVETALGHARNFMEKSEAFMKQYESDGKSIDAHPEQSRFAIHVLHKNSNHNNQWSMDANTDNRTPPAKDILYGAETTFFAAKRLNGTFGSLSFALAYSSMFQTAKAVLIHRNILGSIRNSDSEVVRLFWEHYSTKKEEFLHKSCPLDMELKIMMSDNARSRRNEAFHTGVDNVSKPMVEIMFAYSQEFIEKAQKLMQ